MRLKFLVIVIVSLFFCYRVFADEKETNAPYVKSSQGGLSVRLTVDKDVYKTGEKLIAIILFTNESKDPINLFFTENYISNNFTFFNYSGEKAEEAWLGDVDEVPPTGKDFHQLKPGGTFKATIEFKVVSDEANDCHFDSNGILIEHMLRGHCLRTGEYTGQYIYQINESTDYFARKYEIHDYWKGTVVSNNIDFKVASIGE